MKRVLIMTSLTFIVGNCVKATDSQYLGSLLFVLKTELSKDTDHEFDACFIEKKSLGDIQKTDDFCKKLLSNSVNIQDFWVEHDNFVNEKRVGVVKLPLLSSSERKTIMINILPIERLEKKTLRSMPKKFKYGKSCLVIEAFNPVICEANQYVVVFQVTYLPAILSDSGRFLGYPIPDTGYKMIVVGCETKVDRSETEYSIKYECKYNN